MTRSREHRCRLLDTLARLEADERAIRALTEKAAWHRDKVFEVYSRIVRDYQARVAASRTRRTPFACASARTSGGSTPSTSAAATRWNRPGWNSRRASSATRSASSRARSSEAPGGGRAGDRGTGGGIRGRQGAEAALSRVAARRTGVGPIGPVPPPAPVAAPQEPAAAVPPSRRVPRRRPRRRTAAAPVIPAPSLFRRTKRSRVSSRRRRPPDLRRRRRRRRRGNRGVRDRRHLVRAADRRPGRATGRAPSAGS